MTTIPITGKIIAVEVAEEDAAFGYAEYSDSNHTDPKTVIEPTGNKISIYQLTHSTVDPNGGAGFILSDDFNIGDVVECYAITNNSPYAIGVQVYDNNNHGLLSMTSSDPVRKAKVVKKVFSGTGNDWLTYN